MFLQARKKSDTKSKSPTPEVDIVGKDAVKFSKENKKSEENDPNR